MLFIDIEQAISQKCQNWIICIIQKKYSLLTKVLEVGG